MFTEDLPVNLFMFSIKFNFQVSEFILDCRKFSLQKIILLAISLLLGSNLFSQSIYNINAYDGQTVNTCSGFFYDSGGSVSDYGNGENKTVTFCSNSGNSIQFNFTTFATAPGDILRVYDGPDTSSPLIGAYSAGLAPGIIYSSGTCLTFNFTSNASIPFTGWEATISCICAPVIISSLNPINDVCEGSTVNYYVTDHAGSTYDWSVANGTPATITAGTANQDITWNVSGSDDLGIIMVTETNFCGSTAFQLLFVNIYSIPTITGTTPGSVCGTGTVTLGANASAGIVRWYDLPSGGTLLATGNTFTTPSISATTTYYAEAYNNGCITGSRTPVIATVLSIPTITSTTPGSRCDDGTVYLSATASAGTVNWYDASTGGSLVGTGPSYTTPDISSTTTYYVIATDNGCTTGTRTSIIATVNTTPTITGTTPDSRCGTGTVTLGASSSAGTINWYDVSSGGSTLGTGSSFITPDISSTTTYYVDATSIMGGCVSTPRTTVDATVHPLPVVSFSGLIPEYDLSDPASILIGNPLGGVFSGPGISGITFTPSAAGEGTHSITYTYSDGLCTNFTSQNTKVSNYDQKAGAKLITSTIAWCSGNAQFTTVGATADEIKGSCWPNGPNYNRWFKFQATSTDIHIQLKTGGAEGTLQHPFLALFDASNIQLGCAVYSSQYSDIDIVTSDLTIGNWYYISVDNYVGTGYRGTFTLCVDESINYDLKDGAITIPSISNWCSADGEYSTVGATADQLKGSCWNNGPNYNRWFKFQATSTGNAKITLKTGGAEGTIQNPFLALWDAANTQLGCATYSSQYSDLEIVAQGLTEGEWYYISVDNYSGTGYRGTFTLCVDETINYDLKAGAVVIPSINAWCSTDGQFTTLGATGDELKGSCWPNGPNYNRWFKFQASATGVATIQLKTGGAEGTLQYPFMALWDDANNQLGCARYSLQYDDIVIVTEGLTPLEWYYISVDNYSGTGYRGTFSLCIDETINYDLKAGAVTIPSIVNWCSADAEYTTIGATPDEQKGSCWNNGPNFNRWFKFQATASGIAHIQLKTGGVEGTIQYPFMALWDASNAQIGCATYSSQYSDIDIVTEGLTDGEWYYISVDNNNNTSQRGTFSLCIDESINYDLKAGAIEISNIAGFCSPDAAYTTIGATPDQLKGSCWNNGPNYNRWFKFQATATGVATIQLKTGAAEGTLQYPFLALWDASNNQLGCARYSSQYSDLDIVAEGLTPFEWYYVSVDNSANTGYRGTFSLCIDETINYDLKAGAVTIPSIVNWCSSDAEYTTLGATPDEIKGTCWNNGPNFNRWFKFKATASGRATIQLKTGAAEGTLQYPFLALWDATNTQLGCATNTSQYSDIEIVTDGLTPDEWYYISVDNSNNTGYRGTFTLCVDESINYDLKSGAYEISDINNFCSPDAAFTTVGATPDEIKGSCWSNGPNYNRWFKFKATSTGVATIKLKTGGAEGTLRNPFMALWDASNTQLGCARYSSTYSDIEIVAQGLTEGEWYYVSVDNYIGTGYRGTFSLCIDQTINYDLKAGAIEIPDINNFCSPEAAYSTIDATGDELKGSCWSNGPNYNRWFKFQATATSSVTIQLKTGGSEGTLQNPFMALWDEDGTTQLGCARYSSQYSDLEIVADGLTPGASYLISVDNYVGTGYRGTFTLCIDASINYDLKAGAIEIPVINDWCSSAAAYSTIGATGDELKGACWSNGPNYNRWFKFQATASGIASIQMKTGGVDGTIQYPFMSLWDESNNEIGCSRYTSQYSNLEIVTSGLVEGDWYYISVDNYTGTGYRGTFSLCVDDKLSYNFKDGAIELSDLNGWCSTNAEFSTVGASADEIKGTCWPNGPNYNRWFKFQANGSAISVQVRTTNEEGTLRRPLVALWDASMAPVACNLYTTDNSDVELSSTALISGNTYYISVDNYVGTGYEGSFTLCATSTIPNDNYVNAYILNDFNSWCSPDAKYTNSIATPDGIAGSCFGGGVNKRNVWFKFQALNSSVTATVTTGGNFGSMSDQQIAIFDATNTQIGCTGPLSGQGSLPLTVNGLTIDDWYWISVDDNNISGTFSLCIDDNNIYTYPSGAYELTDLNNWCSPAAGFTNVGSLSDTKSGSCWTAGVYNNKWFKFQATTDQIKVQIKTGAGYGSMVRQQVALWDGTGGQIGCSSWVTGTGTVVMQSDALTPGDWYWISVDDANTSGTFTLCIDDAVDYDYKNGAIVVPTNWCSSDAAYDNIFATDDESMGSCWSGSVNKNVWFRFTALTSFMKVSVITGGGQGTMVRQQVALWNNAGTQVGCAKWVTGQGTVTLQTLGLTAGTGLLDIR